MFSTIIPIRKKDKQLEIFECNDFSLLERKIRDFKKIDLIDEIIVASDSLEIKEQVENFDVKFYLRKEEEVQDNLEFFIKNLVLN
ncbi:hypothetical protein UXV75_001570, partial [Campylobacter coli]|nr:hypothetical protein [Campylobacter coli]